MERASLQRAAIKHYAKLAISIKTSLFVPNANLDIFYRVEHASDAPRAA